MWKNKLNKSIEEINNNKMLTFNIHQIITDNEIVQFMIKNKLLKMIIIKKDMMNMNMLKKIYIFLITKKKKKKKLK